jgi:glycosyltransferase involved in cell wall biosynthesis
MARAIRPPMTGVGRYTHDLVRALARRMDPSAMTLYVTSDARALDDSGCRLVRPRVRTPHELSRALWEQTAVSVDAFRAGLDLYHSPNHTLPLTLRCPSVVTIHDLAFLDRHLHKLTSHIYLTTLTTLALRRATRVIAVSEATRTDLEARFPFLEGRVTVVYEGVDPGFHCPADPAAVRAFRERHGLDRPYILFVGSIEPRKNLPRLFRAFERVVREQGLPHDLVLCGPLGWRYGPSVHAWESSPLRARMRRPGVVPAGELPLWYAGADLLAYPSLSEGFGLPPLEAMARGTPVVTSDCSSLPEVVGDAALTAPPRDVAAIAGAIGRVLTEPALADDLRARGLARVRRFSWDEAARGTIAVYERALSR